MIFFSLNYFGKLNRNPCWLIGCIVVSIVYLLSIKSASVCIRFLFPMALQPILEPYPPVLRFLYHTQLDAWCDSSGWVISPSQRPLPIQDKTSYKHNRQTSMHSAGFEPPIPLTKRPKTYAYAAGFGVCVRYMK
jgi:hypothetical protein